VIKEIVFWHGAMKGTPYRVINFLQFKQFFLKIMTASISLDEKGKNTNHNDQN
jgi:hypothetical protein